MANRSHPRGMIVAIVLSCEGIQAPGGMTNLVGIKVTPDILLKNVNGAHKYVFRLSTCTAALPIILGFAYFEILLRGNRCELRF